MEFKANHSKYYPTKVITTNNRIMIKKCEIKADLSKNSTFFLSSQFSLINIGTYFDTIHYTALKLIIRITGIHRVSFTMVVSLFRLEPSLVVG